MKKAFISLLSTVIGLFIIFVSFECIRLKMYEGTKPLLITDETKYCVSCIKPGEEIEMEYYSLGFKLKTRYYLSKDSSDDNKIILVNGEEFLLFNRYRIWAWIK